MKSLDRPNLDRLREIHRLTGQNDACRNAKFGEMLFRLLDEFTPMRQEQNVLVHGSPYDLGGDHRFARPGRRYHQRVNGGDDPSDGIQLVLTELDHVSHRLYASQARLKACTSSTMRSRSKPNHSR